MCGNAERLLQQQVRRAHRAGRQDQAVAGDRVALERARVGLDALRGRVVDDVLQLVAATLARRERAHLVARADVGARVPGGRDVRVVQRVLRAVVAADVALGDVLAGQAGRAVDVRPILADRLADRHRVAVVGERHGEVDEAPVVAELLCRVAKRPRLARQVGRQLVDRVLLDVHHALDAVVVRVEVGARDGPVLVAVLPRAVAGLLAHEPLLVLAQQDVGVDQRAAAQTARADRVDVLEAPHVEHAVKPLAGVPELRLHPQRRAREGVRREWLAALEQAHAVPGLGQAVRRHRSAESGSHDDGIEMLWGCGQRLPPDSCGHGRESYSRCPTLLQRPNGPLSGRFSAPSAAR